MRKVLWRFVKILLKITGLLAAFLLGCCAFLLAWPAMLTVGVTRSLSKQMEEPLTDYERIGLMAVAFFVTAVWTLALIFLAVRWYGIHIHVHTITPL